jgi:predicted ATPase
MEMLERSVEWERRAEQGGTRDLLAIADAESDNVRLSLDWLESNDPVAALALLSHLGWFWRPRGRAAEGYARFEAAAAEAPEPFNWTRRGCCYQPMPAAN